MAQLVPDVVICGLVITAVLLVHFFSDILRISFGGYYTHATLSQLVESQSTKEYSWLLKLLANCFGYSCVFVPGYLIYKYVKRTNYLEKNDKTCIYTAVSMCITGSPGTELDYSEPLERKPMEPLTPPNGLQKHTKSQETLLLFWCFGGLMVSYLTWGVLQEKIMTQQYFNYNGQPSHFKDSQFLVFCNRLSAFICAIVTLRLKRPAGRHCTPLYMYSFASFSNIMSAWFQYEALKFVSFPTQVLAKACKIIPVMLMGKIISKNKYDWYEYVSAVLISLGMIFFMTGSANSTNASSVTTFTGIFLLTMYLTCDSFTANWQDDLFKNYEMSSLQMMAGVNLFSTIFTATSLWVQGGFIDSLTFASEHPKFILDAITISMCSAVGQLFIFYTISVFGAVVFTIIMTLRQAFAILLSCLIYKHKISVLGIFGILVVFFAVFMRSYGKQRMKVLRKRAEAHKPKMAA
ncbi:adenosine 3'-phospho 5'-phosphosulfate transporter 1 isoform X2 [Rhagoletis pomonella]|uniref:adenosine 3'-phospho 5'-phosphosulfate transporter 1 isoform X1 n=1 Tax=Rhagoletis pomonella TaxID=28610 RepID=UPI0017824F39|nr:adenosine 3'-phospho 5'-phosphosulfate transporter 1 isoform X1 [Rhagoletis pomonella]XP_036329709.1 adenosine 3'-phospho 5'-phosphosulfate transporter 1 isoform X1 [Rhagoletis pomonella]XP_036329715.1 adenosine 3'-phospho 5'-phosphosulfate transporter 1 isoform X1 [Rhagoletis pomonella]XP_036329720.1 adenosine 3'-phospho 5'-phosphosulfate transporter 1 isoform X1 [Rhagoletis pomonella]XP_036329725.1 adenosine 3'-phospho 5'-phosphosulfate transporter 1 isoform X1 [Rhagoletis pomonella]XP_03